jgi:uncharacterized membrane protein YcaP (DUF421 family)
MSLTAGVVVVTFGALAILTSFISLKSLRFRKLVDSKPVVVIARGEMVRPNMDRLRLTTGMLTSLLREKSAFEVADVEYAIMENDGKLSVLLKSNRQPATPFDLHIATPYRGLACEIIIDGSLMAENLKTAGKDEAWLMDRLKEKGIQRIQDVFYASTDSSGNLYITLGGSGEEKPGEYGIE